jgi:hypothetical protein
MEYEPRENLGRGLEPVANTIAPDLYDFPDAPAGFRADDFLLGSEVDGFVGLPVAAERMGKSEQDVLALVWSGVLKARGDFELRRSPPSRPGLTYEVRGFILVRPALVYAENGQELTA